MKQLSIFILSIFFVFNSFSQTTTDAQKILDESAAKIKSARGLSANFSLTQKDKYGHVTGSANGVIKIKDDKYYLKEGKTQVFCNGAKTWNYDGENEVMVSNVDKNNTDDFSPQQILTGFSKEDFTTSLVSSAGTTYQVQLIPTDKRKSFKQIVLYINKTSKLVTKARITDKTGGYAEINFSTVSLNNTIADSEFNFDAAKHPGVEIINQ